MVDKGQHAPAYSFKSGQRHDPTYSQKNHKAGPGSYSPDLSVNHSMSKLKREPRFTMAGKHVLSTGTHEKSPGVGSYSL